jgi:hypothetical protein
MLVAETVDAQRSHVLRAAVTLIRRPTIDRVGVGELNHQLVAGNLRQDRSGGNRRVALISLDHNTHSPRRWGGLSEESGRHGEPIVLAVYNNAIRRFGECVQGAVTGSAEGFRQTVTIYLASA